MKKHAILIVIALAFGSVQAQAKSYGVAGCGLGSVVMGKDGSQVLAVTTNGTSYSQFFGISSGTSNCTDDGAVSAANQVPMFIESNRVALANDVARGSGETLANLSEVMGCSNPAHLASTLQRNYGVIFPSEQVETAQITDSIKSVVKSDARLSIGCAI
jgi:hypothetical protein